MVDQTLFGVQAGPALDLKSDAAREAIASLRGYAYQALATAVAWLDLPENGRLYLEVSEDYTTLVEQVLSTVQIKDTKKSGVITLNSKSVRRAISSFVDLVTHNPNVSIFFHFVTTSELGQERQVADRPGGLAGLEYWRRVAAGRVDVAPLRTILESSRFPVLVREFSQARDDQTLRRDLIDRIHWECGQPEFSVLREELERRFVLLGRNRFALPAPDALRLVDLAVFHVLKKSITEDRQGRFLTLADLYRLIDEFTQVSVRKADVHSLLSIGTKLEALFGAEQSDKQLTSIHEVHWLVDGATLPIMKGVISRNELELEIANTLDEFGAAVVVGSSGLGKSITSHAVANARSQPFYLVHFRDLDEREVCMLLDMIFVRIGEFPACTIVLEDLNCVERPRVALSLARVTEALRRRYRTMIVTCHRKPSISVLTTVGLDPRCVVRCGYLSEDEASTLVSAYEGEPNVWGRLAHVAGGFGHPQLTHAFVKGVAFRRWPIKEMETILDHGFSSEDIDAVREDSRRTLLAALPQQTRNLLYRLSLAIGSFDRSIALSLGNLSPVISDAGESLDQLIGPWLEGVGGDRYRVSPLVSGAGAQMLSIGDQQLIHHTMALHRLGDGKINVHEIDTILLHAISGKSTQALSTVVGLLVTADTDTLENLAECVMFFRFLKMDSRIFPEDPFLSALLRLAQFNLAAAHGERSDISDIVDTLFSEVSALPEGDRKQVFEYFALVSVLRILGIANHLSQWLSLLVKLKDIIEEGHLPPEVVSVLDSEAGDTTTHLRSGLFTTGSGNLASVKRLEHIISQLDGLDPDCRELFLTPMDEALSDYSLFINGPWNKERNEDHFDPIDVSKRYERMAKITRTWRVPSLSLQCTVAQAIMLDEYQKDTQGALGVIREAISEVGEQSILRQALARTHFNGKEYPQAFDAFRKVADQMAVHNPVDRAFSLREAAICAAKCNDWVRAKAWFMDARTAAEAVETEDMDVMAIGLAADSAVASLETGKIGEALRRLAEAIGALRQIDPERSLRAAHCHRVVRHTVLWAQSRIQGTDVRVEGLPIRADAGICSNPDPLPEIRELPLGHMDMALYMLAASEASVGLDEGIASGLADQLEAGHIPTLEFDLRRQKIIADIERLNALSFSERFIPYIEAATFVLENRERIYKNFNALAPERQAIPALDLVEPFTKNIREVATGPLLSFAIVSITKERKESISELHEALIQEVSGSFPGQLVFDQLQGRDGLEGELARIVADTIAKYLKDDLLNPNEFWIAGLRFFEWANQSLFKDILVPHLAAWQRKGWQRLTQKERFRLSTPNLSVPKIEYVLNVPEDNERFLASLILATADAVGSSLGREYREMLADIAGDAG